MRRLVATLRQDVQLQARNGFYAAAAFVLFIWAALLSQAPRGELVRLLPPLVLGNALLSGFYFVGGLVLLERAEGSLLARAVTPLRPAEYLGARILSLALLTLAENLALAVLFAGPAFAALPLAAGIMLGTALLTLIGFIVVLRYESINEYLLPSVGITSVLSLPAMTYVAGYNAWPLFLHPLQPAMLLLEGAVRPLAPWELLYAALAGSLWLTILFAYSTRAYRRSVAGM